MLLASSFLLAKEQRESLLSFVRRGVAAARAITRAHVLLHCGKGEGAVAIARKLGLCADTVHCILERYEEGGLERALFDRPRPGQPRRFTDQQIQHITALACSKPPLGCARWTIDLLKQEIINQKIVPTISRHIIAQILHHHDLRPWRKKNVVCCHNHSKISRQDERRTRVVREAL
jgi:transposase